MRETRSTAWGLKAISVFYIVGVVAVVISLFTNRATVGKQLALVHGLPSLPAVLAFALTILMGVLVVAGINSMRAWGYWLTTAYMAYLLLFPPLAMGGDRVSLFANVFWPATVLIYLFIKRRSFGVGLPAERLTRAST